MMNNTCVRDIKSAVCVALAAMAFASLTGLAHAAPTPIGSIASIAEMQALGANAEATPTFQVLSYHPG